MPTITRSEYVTINGVPLATPAWEVLDLAPLWQGPDVRGADRLVPGNAGVVPYRRRATVSRRTLPMVIYGDKNQNGGTYSNVRDGLWANVDYLRTNVTDPYPWGDGTVTCVLHLPDGTTLEGPVHVLGMDLGILAKNALRATLDLSIPDGSLGYTSS